MSAASIEMNESFEMPAVGQPFQAGLNEHLEMPALGRPFRVGMLYDQHREKIIPGITMWNKSEVARNTTVKKHWSTSRKVIENNDTRTTNLEITGGLKLSLLGDMFKVEGVAKYIYDRKSSTRQAEVTVKYSSTTHYEDMSMEQINDVQYPDIEKSGATHVVLGLMYGTEAFLVFTQDCKQDDSLHKIQKKIVSSVKFLDGLSGDLSTDRREEFIEHIKHLDLQVYGDVPLEEETTVEGKYNAIKKFTTTRETAQEYAVVKTVFLYPLCRLNSLTWQVPRVFPISEDITSEIEEILQYLYCIQMELNDIANGQECQIFASIYEQIFSFSNKIKKFMIKMKQELSEVIYEVRQSGKTEKIKNFIQCIQQSPFNEGSLKKYVQNKKCEVEILNQHIMNMKGLNIKFPCRQEKVRTFIHDTQVEGVLCLCLNVIALETPQMKKMADYMKNSITLSHIEENQLTENKAEWFSEVADTRNFIETMKQFAAFAEDNKNNSKVIFAVLEKEENIIEYGPKIIHYKKNGVSETLRMPLTTPTPVVGNITSGSIVLSLASTHNNQPQPHSWLVQYRYENKEWNKTCTNRNTITLSGLRSSTKYQITAQATRDSYIWSRSELVEATTTTPSRWPWLFSIQ